LAVSISDDSYKQIQHHDVVEGHGNQVEDPRQMEIRIAFLFFVHWDVPRLDGEFTNRKHERIED